MIYCLAPWYSGSVSGRNSGWEWTVCVACDVRKRGTSHNLTSPLSLRGDSHSENLTGFPEAETVRKNWKREVIKKSDKKQTCLSRKPNLS